MSYTGVNSVKRISELSISVLNYFSKKGDLILWTEYFAELFYLGTVKCFIDGFLF
jgi:hypothetical protein